jgi:hypothetical protein
MDYSGIASGSFELVILGNIKASAHFLVQLTRQPWSAATIPIGVSRFEAIEHYDRSHRCHQVD